MEEIKKTVKPKEYTVEPIAANVKACSRDTARGAYISQLFSAEGVSAKTSVLGVNAKNSKGKGKLWKEIAGTLGYGFRSVLVGADEKGKGGCVTHFGILPDGVDKPLFKEKKEKKAPVVDESKLADAEPVTV